MNDLWKNSKSEEREFFFLTLFRILRNQQCPSAAALDLYLCAACCYIQYGKSLCNLIASLVCFVHRHSERRWIGCPVPPSTFLYFAVERAVHFPQCWQLLISSLISFMDDVQCQLSQCIAGGELVWMDSHVMTQS